MTMASAALQVSDEHQGSLREALHDTLAHLSRILPGQAAIDAFIHFNPLQAFQHLHFREAVRLAQKVYGAEPYLSQAAFREHIERGRIDDEDLRAVVAEKIPQPRAWLFGKLTERDLLYALLRYPVRIESEASLRFLMAEREVTRRLRAELPPELHSKIVAESSAKLRELLRLRAPQSRSEFARLATGELDAQRARRALEKRYPHSEPHALLKELEQAQEEFAASALFTTCLELVSATQGTVRTLEAPRTRALPRDVALAQDARDLYDLLFPTLIRLSAAYLDVGISHWRMPGRKPGFYLAVRALAVQDGFVAEAFQRRARHAFQRQAAQAMDAEAAVLDNLRILGVDANDVPAFLERLLLTLPGWAGLMNRLEQRPDPRMHGEAPACLLDFVAVRLTYEIAAFEQVLAERDWSEQAIAALLRTHRVSAPAKPLPALSQAYRLFELLQLLGISFATLRQLSDAEARDLLTWLESQDDLALRELLQEAFERNYRHTLLDALASHRKHTQVERATTRPRLQVISCFDDREESLRRHVEEVFPEAETFGAPGFFGTAMRFQGLDDHRHAVLAPGVANPTQHIEEHPRHDQAVLHAKRKRRRKVSAHMNYHAHVGSRTLLRGFTLNLALGLWSAVPLVTRVSFPSFAGWVKRALRRKLLPMPQTHFTLQRDAEDADAAFERGFTLAERVDRVATLLENIGLTRNFSQLVLILGHGSTHTNNPHKSAYDCAACGGRQGGPNARVVAHMANASEVRSALRARGIDIPDDCTFVGGQHDTCSDEITLFDLVDVADGLRPLLAEVQQALDKARALNAQERCRRLFNAPRRASPAQALAHVRARSEHLAQPRAEVGHATNAVAVIGRRNLTRGLFLDRRALLLSYDPSEDADGQILERVLAAAIPVGAGINLDYYFSHVDNERYGAGSKLPHNISALHGVMTGHSSDLRTGLPRHMIELHEAMRLLVVVEATPQRLLELLSRNPEVRDLVLHRWVQLVSLEPERGAMQVFTDAGFVPYTPSPAPLPERETSQQVYFGREGFLPPARITGRKPHGA